MARWMAWVGMVCAAGCSFDTRGTVAGDADAAAAGDDGASPDAAIPATLCADEQFRDDFDDDAIGSYWSAQRQLSALDEQNGTLIVTAVADDQREGVSSELQDFRDHTVILEIAAPNPGSGVVGVSLSHGAEQDFVAFLIDAGMLQAWRYSASGSVAPNVEDTWDPIAHRFLKLQVIGDSALRYETSPNGENWTQFTELPSLTVVRNTRLEIGTNDRDGTVDTVGTFGLVVLCRD